MPNVDWQLLSQIPTAICLIVVTWLFLRSQKEDRIRMQQMTKEFIDALTRNTQAFNATIQSQQTTFMQAIKEQREQHLKSLNDITDSIANKVQEFMNFVQQRLYEMAQARAVNRRRRNEPHIDERSD